MGLRFGGRGQEEIAESWKSNVFHKIEKEKQRFEWKNERVRHDKYISGYVKPISEFRRDD